MRTWRERQRQEREDREREAAADKVGTLMGFDADNTLGDHTVELVGWKRVSPDTVKGTDHYCIACSPGRPGPDAVVVLQTDLAATMACSRCGKPLEGVGR